MSIQILHCSDPHLDKNFNIPNLARRQKRKEDLEQNFSAAVAFALKNRPDLFLLTGDVFDRISPSNAERVFVTHMARQLKEAGIPLFIIGGNHDVPKTEPGVGAPYLAIDVLSTAALATVFSRSDIFQRQTLSVDGRKVCVEGKSYFAQSEGNNPFKDGALVAEEDYNILMLHGSLRGLEVAPLEVEMASQNPFQPEDIPKGVDLLALGHFHNHFIRRYGRCTIVNPGSMERMSWAEIEGEKGFTWIELNGSETSIEFIRLETRSMTKAIITLSRQRAGPRVQDFIMENLAKVANEETMLKLYLQGHISLEQYNQLKISEILDASKDMFFNLTIDRSNLEVEGYGRVFFEHVENPIQAYTKRLQALMGHEQSENKRRFLEEVLKLGMKYLEEQG